MVHRRTFLSMALSAAALSFVNACQRRLIKPPVCPHYNPPHLTRVVDAHCHIFNGSDLQVAGFINQVKLGGRPVPDRSLLGVIGNLIQSTAWRYAPSAEDELQWLTKHTGPREVTPVIAEASTNRTALSAMVRDMGTDTDERFVQFWRELARTRPDQAGEFTTRLTSYKQSQLARFSSLQSRDVLAQLQRTQGVAQFIEEEQEYGDRGIAIVTFLKTFFRFRTENAWSMMWTYGCKSSPSLDLLCPALVDFDLWLGDRNVDDGRTRSHIDKQLNVMQALAQATQGRVRALAPFNPLRAACDGGDGFLKYVRDAVRKSRCIGFKLYPPMGFAATSNATDNKFPLPRCPRRGHAVSKSQLDAVLGAFFDECSELNVPVLAHTSPSNGALNGSESLASPKYWRDLMGTHAAAFMRGDSRVRISLGHMGGDHSLNEPSAWRTDIVQMIKDYPGRVFADLSFYDHILGNDETRAKLAHQLVDLQQPEVSAQVMYGSDWNMLAAVPRSYNYLNAFGRFLGHELQLQPQAQSDILGANALRFYALDPLIQG